MSKKDTENLPAVKQDMATMLAMVPDLPSELAGQGSQQLEQSAQERFPQLYVAQPLSKMLDEVGGPGNVYTVHGQGDLRECEVVAKYGYDNGIPLAILYHFQRYEKWYDKDDHQQQYPIADSTAAVPDSPLHERVTTAELRKEPYGPKFNFRYHHNFYFWTEVLDGPHKGRQFLISMKSGSIKYAKAIAGQMKKFNDALKAQGKAGIPIYAPRWHFYSQKVMSQNNEPFYAFTAEVANPPFSPKEDVLRFAKIHAEVASVFDSYGTQLPAAAVPEVEDAEVVE